MKRTSTVVMALVMIVAMVGAVPLASAAQTGPADAGATTYAQTEDEQTNESDEETNESDEVRSGERLSGVIGVQEAELAGELESRNFGLKIARAATEDAKAELVADQLAANEQRLQAVEERMSELREQREAGEISEGTYRAQMSRLASEAMQADRMANESGQVAEELPADVLEQHGVNVEAIQQLRENASELTGGEVADIAREIAGPTAGQRGGAPDGAPGADERPETSENASDALDRAEREVEIAEERVDAAERQVTDGDEEAAEALENAKAALSNAEEALAAAQEAVDADDGETAIERADDAADYAENALELAEEAVDSAEQSERDDRTGDEGADAGDNDNHSGN